VDYFLELLKKHENLKEKVLSDLKSDVGLSGLGGCAYFHEVQACLWLQRHVEFKPQNISELEAALREHFKEELHLQQNPA